LRTTSKASGGGTGVADLGTDVVGARGGDVTRGAAAAGASP
jgi:hypothetical protein